MSPNDDPISETMLEMRHRAELLGELGRVGERRAAALSQARRDLKEIAKLARGAVGTGATLTDIANAAGVSRVTLYKLLDEKPAQRRARPTKGEPAPARRYGPRKGSELGLRAEPEYTEPLRKSRPRTRPTYRREG